ncbi:hypothetical protein ABZ770_33245 [Streptomyces sp. NPDC006654]|uniref:hypothetical protein n=1 Tax=Streptomyces sp. NPDC006654 TaxID=3156897 RepID=UPI003410FA4E
MNRHLDPDLTARDTVPVPRAPEGRPAAALGRGAGAPIAWEQHLVTSTLIA